ncbi:LuxR family transcriptional regulator [Thiospirochaeta perfilievii]|uniref:LuxR family transcriptional regulator n=1 Tax=Thiospirochaeta perfilievii TaxID=252967 RepID=A0A5C1QEI4_9SPIO|nr:helix-turn-helix transcriptional regulator [Thiospirochaeta perfilievii]QEN05480.1 LuxR family transcriptional regulator [Thiospirochaeta perfilievii]
MSNKSENFGIIIGVISFIFLLFNFLIQYTFYKQVIFEKEYAVLIFISIVMLFSYIFIYKRIIQVLTIFISTIYTFYILNHFGLGMLELVILILLLDKYSIFKKRDILKTTILLTLFFILLVTSQLKNNALLIDRLYRYIYFILATILITFLKSNNISFKIERYTFYKNEISKLKNSLKLNQEILKRVNIDYIDPLEAGLSVAELEILENLCLYRETNAELATRLKKSTNTVKVQMKSILVKIGAETRYQLIDLCKYYYHSVGNIDPINGDRV